MAAVEPRLLIALANAHIRLRHLRVILNAEMLQLSEYFGSGLCVNEEARVKVFDALY